MEVLGGAFARDHDSIEFGGFSTVELRAESVCSLPLGRPTLPLRDFHPAKGTMPTEPRHISTGHLEEATGIGAAGCSHSPLATASCMA